MKFNIAATDLLNMGVVLSRFAAKDALDGFGFVEITIYDGMARFKTSNHDQTATVDYSVDSSRDGVVIVEANRFLKLAKAFTGIVTIEQKDHTLHFKQGKSKYNLQIAASPHMMAIEPLDDAPIKIDFSDVLSKMTFAIDNAADNCMGFYWFNDEAIAVSNQFTLCEVKLGTPTGLISCVPPSAVRDIKGKVDFRQNGRQVDISYGNFYLSSRLVEYPFPPYRKIIPDHENYISVERGSLMEILKRIGMVTDTGSVKIGVEGSELFVKVTTESGSGYDNVAGTVNKPFGVEVALNLKYITSALAAVGGEVVQLYFGTESQPVIIKNSEHDDFITLIMPMRQ